MDINNIPIKQDVNPVVDSRTQVSAEEFNALVDAGRDEEYEEVESYVEIEGVESYEDVVEYLENAKNISRKINRLGLTDNEALSVKEAYPTWKAKINHTIEQGYIVLHDDKLWRARQTHTALEVYPPSIDTAALYEVVVYKHEGTKDDPIPYTPPMEIYEGKYYSQDGVTYLCTRGSDNPVYHALKDLIGLYVEVVS